MEEKDYSTGPVRREYEPTVAPNRRRISWGAIFAGTVSALAVQLMLTLLGTGIGAWAINPSAGADGMNGIGIAAGIWAGVSFIIALFVGGWVAGRMSGLGSKMDGLLEGFLVWGAVTVLTFALVTSAIGNILGGAAGLAGNTLAMGAEQVQNPKEMVQEFGAAARDNLDDPQEIQDAKQAARETGEAVASGTAQTSLWAFGALVLGGAAAAMAGRMGSSSAIKETEESRVRRAGERH